MAAKASGRLGTVRKRNRPSRVRSQRAKGRGY